MGKRIWAVFIARNIEFIRDKSTFGWNVLFPFFLVFGLSFIFSGDGRPEYKIGISGLPESPVYQQIIKTKYIDFVHYRSVEKGQEKVRRHQLDLFLDLETGKYWLNEDSPKGYLAEKVVLGTVDIPLSRSHVAGKAVRYIDWVLPGVLAMNMMFSGLFGVGYVIVRYRKNGVLKRLKATPLSAAEFLIAQLISRFVILMVINVFLYVSCDIILDFYMVGSYLDLTIIAMLGAASMIAMGLLISAQIKSEELAGGLLNMAIWPMMVLSGVWYSLEGSPEWVQNFSQILPLTHIISGARAIIIDGATLFDIWYQVLLISGFTAFCILVGAWSFNWGTD